MTLYPVRKNSKLKGNKNPQEIFYESTQKLFRLLSHHPHFLAGAGKLRSKYKIPFEDITDISKLLVWQHNHKKQYDKLVSDEELSKLLADFKIARELQRATGKFMLDYIQTNNLITTSIFDNGLNVIRASDDRKILELKPDCIYLEITPHTTVREIKDRWKNIVGGRKEIREYGIPATTKIEERVWELYEQGLETNEITPLIKKEFHLRVSGYSETLKLKSNYKKALSKLRKVN